MEEPTTTTEGAAPMQAAEKTKTVIVQYSVKWVNFDIEVEASSADDAIEKAYAAFEKDGLKDFTLRAGNEEVSSLEDIFRDVACRWARVRDENGNEDQWCCVENDEDEEEE